MQFILVKHFITHRKTDFLIHTEFNKESSCVSRAFTSAATDAVYVGVEFMRKKIC